MSPEQGWLESDDDYRSRVAQKANERTIESSTGSAPSQGWFENEESYRGRISREANERRIEDSTGSAPDQGWFESDDGYHHRIAQEANKRTIEDSTGSAPSQGWFESDGDYDTRIRKEANEQVVEHGTTSAPKQGWFEGDHSYRSRIAHEAREVRAGASSESSSNDSPASGSYEGSASGSGDSSGGGLVVVVVVAVIAFALVALSQRSPAPSPNQGAIQPTYPPAPVPSLDVTPAEIAQPQVIEVVSTEPSADVVTPMAGSDPDLVAVNSDPFSYCRAVRDVDGGEGGVADDKYLGIQPPPEVVTTLQRKWGGDVSSSATWRCMEGRVYACNLGASGRACRKAATSDDQWRAIRDVCTGAPNLDYVPNAVNYSASDWGCAGGRPVTIESFPVDQRGYMIGSWLEVYAPQPLPNSTPSASQATPVMPASPVVSTESTSPARNESPGTPELTEQSSASRVASTPSDLPRADEPTTSGQRTDRGAGEWTFYDGGRSPASATYQPLSADSYQIDFDVKCHSRECNGYVICTVETNRSACIQASPLAWKVVEEIEPIRSGETVHVSKVLPAELLFNQKVDLYLCIGGDPCKISRPIHRKISVGPK